MELTNREYYLVVAAYMNGYESGHNDTVDSAYSDDFESAVDWLNDAVEGGGLTDSFKKVKVDCVRKWEQE